MNSLAQLAGLPTDITVGGDRYEVHPLSSRDFGELQRWLDSKHRSPFEVASEAINLGLFSLAQQQHILRCAMEQATRPTPQVGTPAAAELLDSFEGRIRSLWLMIRKGRPGWSLEDTAALYDRMNEADWLAARVASGLAVISDPKAPSESGSGTPSTTEPPEPPSTGGNSSTS